jgi:tetratricopeptide (TPR) repeat protein
VEERFIGSSIGSWPNSTRQTDVSTVQGPALRGFPCPNFTQKRDFRVSGDASQDSESSQPENEPVVSQSPVFSADRDLQDELPEEEPLTPDMVEEEAVRGDFMLRWAAVGLAVLMGFTQINDTKPLVLIRSGDYMRSHGLLPPRTDVFSLTAAEKPAPNVSWLFDHVVSLSWALAGDKGLTLLKVVIAGIVGFLLTHMSIRGVPTWWNSICAVFAVVACSSDFVPLPELVTMLGMTVTMRWLYQHRLGTAEGLQWKLPLLIAIWCNLDSRAWVGAFVIVLYFIGVTVSNRIAARRSDARLDDAGPSIWLIVGLSVAALLVNPFPGNSILGPVTMYSVEYPAMQAQRRVDIASAAISFDGRVDYYSMLNPSAFRLFDHSQVAGLALLLMAFVVLLLARTRRDLGFLFALLGMTGLSLLAAHELPEAAIVAAVVAGISAQDWYRRAFNQQYTVDSKELLFSRGGRAVTVLALAALGFCVVASRLPGATPLGWGFDRDTQVTMDTFAKQIQNLDPTANILHTRLEQGDLLIWNGRKSFIDSRMLPFGRPGNPDQRPEEAKSVFAKHTILLTTLFHPEPPPFDESQDKAELKKFEENRSARMRVSEDALNEFGITHAMSRLAPPGLADYQSMFNLAQLPQWIPVSIEASAAVLERVSPTMSAAERVSRVPSWTRKAFREAEVVPSTLREFAREPNFYEKHVYRVRPFVEEDLRMAMHYAAHVSLEPESVEHAMSSIAAAHLTIRQLNQVLSQSSSDERAYRLLGGAYAGLGQLERMVGGQDLGMRFQKMRYLQAVMAFRQALVTDPDNEVTLGELFNLYRQQNRIDLASDVLDHLLPMQGDRYLNSDNPQIRSALFEQQERQRDYREMIDENDKKLAEFLEKQVVSEKEEERVQQLVAVAMQLDKGGFVLAALKMLDNERELVNQSPMGSVLRGQLLLECGRLEESFDTLRFTAERARQQPEVMAGIDWQFPTALSQLAISDLASASDIWASQAKELETLQTMKEPYAAALVSLPLTADTDMTLNARIPVWPLRHITALGVVTEIFPASRTETLFLSAMVRIEEANLESARLIMRQVIEGGGESSYRSLASVYLTLLDADAEAFLSEQVFLNYEPYEFPGEPEPPGEDPPGSRRAGR